MAKSTVDRVYVIKKPNYLTVLDNLLLFKWFLLQNKNTPFSKPNTYTDDPTKIIDKQLPKE